jgi:hypothetical protein
MNRRIGADSIAGKGIVALRWVLVSESLSPPAGGDEMERVQIAMTLKQSNRTPTSVAKVKQIAAELGLETTDSGRATVSCRVPPEKFAELFGRPPTPQEARRVQNTDYGTPPGYVGEDLPIPNGLEAFVESIAVVPPATRLDQSVD